VGQATFVVKLLYSNCEVLLLACTFVSASCSLDIEKIDRSTQEFEGTSADRTRDNREIASL
jgi:hypothetical protein